MPTVFRAAVATYNVLSSSYCSPSMHTGSDPQHLDENARYQGLLRKLAPLMEADGAVVCLQEVSALWAGRLHAHFQQRGYHFVFSGYGSRGSGYMGCGVAFPSAQYELQSCAMPTVADTKRQWPKALPRTPPLPHQQSLLGRLWGYVSGPFATKVDAEDLAWDIARKRPNTLVFVRLKARESGNVLCVGTYHMPCVYQHPQTMVIHAALAAQQVQALAGTDPYVFAGDFNAKPRDAAYRLLTEGKLPDDDAAQPRPLDKDTWRPMLKQPLKSAYVVATGKEPDFTNWAKNRDQPEFVDTLDYLFFGNGLRVETVAPLADRAATKGPLPNAAEPSDHVLLSAIFTL